MKKKDLYKPKVRSKKKKAAGLTLAALICAGLGAGFLMPPEHGREALQDGKEKIEQSAVSRLELSELLESSYSEKAAEYALRKLENTDWNNESLQAYAEITKASGLSEARIRSRLESRKFEPEQIDYAFQNGRTINFKEAARVNVDRYLENETGLRSRKTLREHLNKEEFEADQVSFALENCAADWSDLAEKRIEQLLEKPLSEKTVREDLENHEFAGSEISEALQRVKPDFQQLCKKRLNELNADQDGSESGLIKKLTNDGFTQKQAEKAVSSLKADWKYNAVRFSVKSCGLEDLSASDLEKKLDQAGFKSAQTEFVLKYYDQSSHDMPDEDEIRDLIRKEEEARKAAEEKARKEAEEKARQAEEKARKEAEEQARIQAENQQQSSAPAVGAPIGGSVWIPRTGSKYHSYAGCSNMKNPSCVSLSQAQAWGYAPCKKCW